LGPAGFRSAAYARKTEQLSRCEARVARTRSLYYTDLVESHMVRGEEEVADEDAGS